MFSGFGRIKRGSWNFLKKIVVQQLLRQHSCQVWGRDSFVFLLLLLKFPKVEKTKGFFLQFVLKTKHITQQSTILTLSGSSFRFQPFWLGPTPTVSCERKKTQSAYCLSDHTCCWALAEPFVPMIPLWFAAWAACKTVPLGCWICWRCCICCCWIGWACWMFKGCWSCADNSDWPAETGIAPWGAPALVICLPGVEGGGCIICLEGDCCGWNGMCEGKLYRSELWIIFLKKASLRKSRSTLVSIQPKTLSLRRQMISEPNSKHTHEDPTPIARNCMQHVVFLCLFLLIFRLGVAQFLNTFWNIFWVHN